MLENIQELYINKIPSTKKKSNQLAKNISFNKKNISYPKSQCKKKTCKEKLEEDNSKFKKTLSHPKNDKTNEKGKDSHINGCPNDEKSKINCIIQNVNHLKKNIINNKYNDDNYYNFSNAKNFNFFTRNRSNDNNINQLQLNTEYNDYQCKSCKDKKVIGILNSKNENKIRINDIKNHLNNKIPFINYKKNYVNNWRNKIKMNENCSLEINNNAQDNLYINKNKNFSFSLPNEETKYNEISNNLTTSKINGKSKKIYNEDYFKNKELDKIIEYISLENLKDKLDKKIFSKTLNNFQYKKPKINNGITNISDINKEKSYISFSKSNNKTTYVKNIFIKNRVTTTTRITNKILNLDNIDNNKSYYNDGKVINGINNKNNSPSNINIHNFNEIHNCKEYNNIININNYNNLYNINNNYNNYNNNRVKCLNAKIKDKNCFEKDLFNNITTDNIYTPKFNGQQNILGEFNNPNLKENNIRIINANNLNNNIIINNNKKKIKQNNFINENLNYKYNLNKEKSNKTYIKNFSYDLLNNKKRNNMNNIKNIKNNAIIKKNGLTNDKIKKYNIKDILLDISKSKNDNTQIPQFKESKNQNNKNDITIEKINENEETTLYDESIIVNDSDVYGTLTIKNTINNNNIKEKSELNNKDNNEDNIKREDDKKHDINIINIYNNSLRETITINIAEKNNEINNNNNNKIKIEDLLKDKNILQQKINRQINNINNKKNNNALYFKSYYLMTNPGKNYGARKTNQDMPVTFTNLNEIKGFNIFGVLDGHGVNGHHVSKFLSEYLIKEIVNNKEIINLKQLDKIYYNLTKSNYELLINIFFKSDRVLGKQNIDVNFSGTTCVLVIQVGRNLICTNVGDSRAILVYDSKNDSNLQYTEIFELSHDCKPDLPEEKNRIIKMGGTVDQMLDMNGIRCGPQRVWAKNRNFPGLAMSRSLGDFQGKKCGIIPYPEIIEYKLDEKSKYMVICSDGVWEFLSNKNVMDIGNEFYLKNDVEGFTKKLVKDSEDLWEKKDVIVDDITAVVVFF